MRSFTLVAVLLGVAVVWVLIRHRWDAKVDEVSILAAPQIEVGDILRRPDGQLWPANAARSIVIVTSATCAACTDNETFEENLFEKATAEGLPVFFILESGRDQDALANRLGAQKKQVLRADLVIAGLRRTPTILAVDRNGLVLSIHTGSVGGTSGTQGPYRDELLHGASRPLYTRIANAEVAEYVLRVKMYQIIELRNVNTPLPRGLEYRQIPMGELGVRAVHEISKNSTVFVDCNSAGSAFACQNALLWLSNNWTPDHLFAINLPSRRTVRDHAAIGEGRSKK